MKIQMNNEIKVSLSVTLQGSVMLSQEQAKALEKEKVGTGYDTFNMRVESLKGGKKDAETINVKTRKSVSLLVNHSILVWMLMTT